MIPVSDIAARTSQPLIPVEKVVGPPEIQPPEGEQNRPVTPVVDAYIPEEKQEASGCYWVGKDEDGQPKIYFDNPEQPESPSKSDEKLDASAPKAPKEERCVSNTDKVDRELEQLRKKRNELEQQLNTETNEARIKSLEQQLAQVENELSQKDNDTYRRQHTQFS